MSDINQVVSVMDQALIGKNIVVIGGRGSGKSSLLNNLSLMLHFRTLEEAENEAKHFVPPISVMAKFNGIIIDDRQENTDRSDQHSYSKRTTHVCRIKCGNVVINIMDTPGLTEGAQFDEEYVNHIKTCLFQFKDIHGILVVLKSSESISHSNVKYTFDLVLSCLGKTAAKIISYAITHAGYNKNPGSAASVIRGFLNSLSNDRYKNSTENMYCFESSPLLYVLSTKKGVPFAEKDKMQYSWTFANNAKELLELLTRVFKLEDTDVVQNVPALLIAKQILPDLIALLPYLDSKEEELQKELNHLHVDLLSSVGNEAQLAEQQLNVEEISMNIEHENTEIKQLQVKKFQEGKKVLMDLLFDLIWCLEAHAANDFDDTALGYSGRSAKEISSCIRNLKLSGHWNPTSPNIEHNEVITRLSAVRDFKYFAKQINYILAKIDHSNNAQFKFVDIQLESDNVLIRRVLQKVHQ